jgi:c(7)-type cytochrome triheme protein
LLESHAVASACLILFLLGLLLTSSFKTIATSNQYSQNLLLFATMPQGPELDYSNFKHTSQKHTSLACTACHFRKDNSATPTFPGHKACTGCHLAQFVTPNVPMCGICHSDVNNANPPLKNFPTSFKESFNVRFDHAQHMTGNARPASGCNACHSRISRGAALSILSGISAHNQCYTCHTPTSKSQSGRDLASCGVCHEQKQFSRTSTNVRSFRYAFSHAKHGAAQRLACADCHTLTAGAPQSRQVSSPAPLEHFATARGKTCLSCHNGQRSFGGDLAFKDCRRCHAGASFKMPN